MNSRDRLVDAAGRLFARHGHTGVGLKRIAHEAGAPMGSLYHHFPGGKDELTAEALRRTASAYQDLVTETLQGESDLDTAIEECFATAALHLAATDYEEGCPIETVALEVASTNEPLRLVTAEIFEGWIEAAARIASDHGLPPTDARAFAIAFIVTLEGAFVLARSMRNPEPLIVGGEQVRALLRSLAVQRVVDPR